MNIRGARLLAVALLAALATPALSGEAVAADASDGQARKPSNMKKKQLGDPLFRFQWHLENRGQRVFGDELPVAGVDLNMADLHQSGVRGKGVIVGVVDDGLEIRHEDLQDNVVWGGSKNFVDGSNDPTPINGVNGHGTSAAGLIGAVGWNGLGTRGIAPEVRLKGFNMLSEDIEGVPNQDEAISYAWGGGREAADIGVFNNSWARSTPFYILESSAELRSWVRMMQSMRDGKGGIYVKSAGNDFRSYANAACPNPLALQYQTSCIHANADPRNSLESVITVAAVRADGRRSSYSSAGSSIWVSGFGGEYGVERSVRDLGDNFPYAPATVTTDLSGCQRGYNSQANIARNRFDGGSNLDGTCSYTASFNGTSAAAPTVSGVAALMLGVNSSLSARDVKYILAMTARPIDLGQPRSIYQGVTIDPGWVTNGAGHRFSNWYGFGLVDAKAAVDKARNFSSLPARRTTGWLKSNDSASIIGGIRSSASMSVDVPRNLKIETVQVSFNTTHKTPGNLRAVLVSPSGTRSYIFTPFSHVNAPGGFEAKLTASNAFLDERSRGRWSLEVVDVVDANSTATLESFELRVLGYQG
ncbi:S8 family peptidase [Dyella sp.]|uniref:S8 family peptidase n=1 Tax=Dyella sp. TaxID=1869338 RepID=UPI002ED34601